MRWTWVCALIATGCFGGQTGEITDLTACNAPVGTAAVDQASDAGDSAEAQLAALITSIEGELAWQDGDTSSIAVSYALTGEPATLLGGEECERPWLDAPVTVIAQTADGALDETMPGVVLLNGSGAASVRAELAAGALNGALMQRHPDVDPARATLRIDLSSDGALLGGQLALETEGEDGEPIGAF